MPHFITTHSINNPNYIKMQQNKNQQLDAKFRKFIKVLIMAHVIEIPKVDERLIPLVVSLPLQMLAYHIAVYKNRDVDRPRNLAKSVTVE